MLLLKLDLFNLDSKFQCMCYPNSILKILEEETGDAEEEILVLILGMNVSIFFPIIIFNCYQHK